MNIDEEALKKAREILEENEKEENEMKDIADFNTSICTPDTQRTIVSDISLQKFDDIVVFVDVVTDDNKRNYRCFSFQELFQIIKTQTRHYEKLNNRTNYDKPLFEIPTRFYVDYDVFVYVFQLKHNTILINSKKVVNTTGGINSVYSGKPINRKSMTLQSIPDDTTFSESDYIQSDLDIEELLNPVLRGMINRPQINLNIIPEDLLPRLNEPYLQGIDFLNEPVIENEDIIIQENDNNIDDMDIPPPPVLMRQNALLRR